MLVVTHLAWVSGYSLRFSRQLVITNMWAVCMRVGHVGNVDYVLAFHSRSLNHILTQYLHLIVEQYKNQ